MTRTNRRQLAAGLLLTVAASPLSLRAAAGAPSLFQGTPPASPASAVGNGVPMYRADPAHTGVNPGPGPAGDPEVLWRFETGGVRSAPAVVDGTVYVGDLEGVLYALDGATGTERWRFEVGGYVNAPAVVDGIVITSGGGGVLYGIDALTGAEMWTASTEGISLFSEATVSDRILYLGSYDGFIFALDPSTGDLVWEFAVQDRAWIAPAIAGGIVYARSDDGNLYALDAATGAELWSATIGWNNESSSPAVADDAVYVGGADGIVYALDAATGEELWQVQTPGIIAGSAALVDGMVIIGSQQPRASGALYALDGTTGDEVWRVVIDEGLGSSASVAGSSVYFSEGAGLVHCIDVATGVESWTIETDGGFVASDPAIVDGVLYVGSVGPETHHIYAIGNSGTSGATPAG